MKWRGTVDRWRGQPPLISDVGPQKNETIIDHNDNHHSHWIQRGFIWLVAFRATDAQQREQGRYFKDSHIVAAWRNKGRCCCGLRSREDGKAVTDN